MCLLSLVVFPDFPLPCFLTGSGRRDGMKDGDERIKGEFSLS